MTELAKLFSTHAPATVMCTPRMERLAREVVSLCPPDTLLFSQIDWSEFPDGTPHLKLDVKLIQHRDVIFIIDINMREMLPMLSALHAIPRYLARTFHVIVGYFACGTMERVEEEGEVATAKSLARLLSATPNPQIGEPVFHIFDIHALASRFFFADNVKINLLTGITVMHQALLKEPDFAPAPGEAKHKAVIVFPDDGARKRFRICFPADKFDCAVFVKVRKGDQRLLMPVEGAEHVKGRHCVVVDDIAMSGGTLLATADELNTHGAASVSLYATHAVFPGQSWKKFLPSFRAANNSGSPIRHFFTTNSNPICTKEILQDREASQVFRILSLASVIESLIVSDAPAVAEEETPMLA